MAPATIYTEEEVAQHSIEKDCWLIINADGEDRVYDVTKYLSDHPGGPEIMLEFGGKDATDMFEDIGHSSEARKKMAEYLIGTLKTDGTKKVTQKKKSAADVQSKGGLNPFAIVVLLIAIAIGIYYSQLSK